MSEVRSTWADNSIKIGGVLSSQEWSGAGKMAIPAGYLMVKNDAKFLYVALDMVQDKGDDAGTGDYFWFSIDVNRNRQITPRIDINYGIPPGAPNNLGRQYYLGQGVWTGILNEASESRVHIGFGASPNSSTNHRIWEMRLDLKELGVDIAIEAFPVVNFGVRVASTNPKFTYDYPANFYSNFSGLHSILLARNSGFPSGAGSVIGGVGLIPATQIIDGYATTNPTYYVHVDEAAFGDRMNLIGNRVTMQSLWTNGARKYKMMHRHGISGSFSPIKLNWVNYRWNGTTYVLEHFEADTSDMYPLLNPVLDYSIDDLLLQWQSVGYPPGIHEFYTEFYDHAGHKLTAPSQVLRLMVDNNLPQVDIIDIKHGTRSVAACDIEYMTGTTDGIRFKISVEDSEEHLKDFVLAAHYGDGGYNPIYSDSYPAHRSTSHKWRGVSNLLVPSGVWVPPITCAYQFSLTAYPRVTNGYSYLWNHSVDTRHVTLIKPAGVIASVTPRISKVLPYGFLANNKMEVEGKEPEKLGAETEIS